MLGLKNKQNWLTAVSLLFAFLSVHAATFTNDVLSANGEHGDQTVGISHFIFGENWTGSDGGVADESQLLVTHPDAYVSQIHSSGGAGVYYTGALQFGASNSTFTGGNSGRSIGVSEQADVYANGGMGASVSAPQGTSGELPPDQSSPPPPYSYGGSGVVITMGSFEGDAFAVSSNAIITVASTANFATNTTISSGTFSPSMNTLATENSEAYVETSGSLNFTGGTGGSVVTVTDGFVGGDGLWIPNNTVVVTGEDGVLTVSPGGTVGNGSLLASSNSVLIVAGGSLITGSHLFIESSYLTPRSFSYEIHDSVFTGGNAGYAEGLKNAEAEGGAGLYLDTTDGIYLQNVTATAGNGGHAIGTENVIARGGNGLAVHNSTNIVINSGRFHGGNGGLAEQIFTQDLSSAVDASGGNGIYGNFVLPTTLSNVVATGGNGGIATSSDDHSTAYDPYLPHAPSQTLQANGGAGASFNRYFNATPYYYPANSNPTLAPTNLSTVIADSEFRGGDGGTIAGLNLFNSSYGNPSAYGGNGIEISLPYPVYIDTASTNHLTLKNITTRGGNGGHADNMRILYPEYYNNPDAHGGDGATIGGYDFVTIDGGSYSGGNGGSVPEVISAMLMNGSYEMFGGGNNAGGNGMSLFTDHATVLGGMFQGGLAGRNGLRNGYGLYFRGKTLDIFDGQFNATGVSPYSGSYGLLAFVENELNIFGGDFDSIGIIGPSYEYSSGVNDLYISSNATINGEVIINGNTRITQIDPDTFQNVWFPGGDIFILDELFLNRDAYFYSGSSANLTAANATLNPGSVMRIGGQATFDELSVKENAALILSASSYRSYVQRSSGYLTPGPIINADLISFDKDSGLFIDHFSAWYPQFEPMPQIGTSTQIAEAFADDIMMVDGTNTYTMAQEDLNRISSPLNESLLTSYDFILGTSSNQQIITVYATSTPLSGKSGNPLPDSLTAKIDSYRSGEPISEALQLKLALLMQHLDNPTGNKQTINEIRRYFGTAASPMVMQAVQAGQQAQLTQVLRHVDAFRNAGGMASSSPSPTGAAGPNEARKGWSGWMKGYGTDASKDPDGDFVGYDANIAGAVIGVENSFGNSLVGVAGGSARTDVDTDEPGSSDVDTYFGSIYGSYGADAWFIDSSLAYGHNKVEASRGTVTPSQAQYDADNVMGYVGGGRQYRITEKLMVTPEAGGQLTYYHQDSFTETGIMNNTYDAYDYWFFQSILGANAAMAFPAGNSMLFQPDLRLHWRHNFNADPDRISYITDGTGTGSSAGIQSPEEDTLVIGAGLVSTIKERVDIDLRIEQQLADGWKSTTYSGSLKIRF